MKRNPAAKPPPLTARDEATMRAFYESCGISAQTTDAAILARRNNPVEESEPSDFDGQTRMRQAASSGKPPRRKG
jgi:hypothetical protein